MTRGMRKFLAGLLALTAVGALVAMVAALAGAPLGPRGTPLFFARLLVVSAGLLFLTLRWRRGR